MRRGVVAALCIVDSTTITDSAAYICTEVLLAATSMAALFYLVEFFHYKGRREWLVGMLLLGCAVGCKYTAFLLFISYCMTETLLRIQNRREEKENDAWLDAKVPRKVLVCILLGCGLIALAAALVFPTTAAMNFIAKTRANPNLKDPALYLAFFHHIRLLLAKIAILSVAVAILIGWVKMIYDCVALRRLYYGLGIIVLVSIIATPYSLITPRRFLYDLGALARANVIVTSNHAHWGSYASWLAQDENMVLLVLSAIGLGIAAFQKESKFLVVAVYLRRVSVCDRFGLPGLPTVSHAVASDRLLRSRRSADASLGSRVGPARHSCQIGDDRFGRHRFEAGGNQNSRRETTSQGQRRGFCELPGNCFFYRLTLFLYAENAPGVELGLAGIPTKRVSWATLAPKGAQRADRV